MSKCEGRSETQFHDRHAHARGRLRGASGAVADKNEGLQGWREDFVSQISSMRSSQLLKPPHSSAASGGSARLPAQFACPTHAPGVAVQSGEWQVARHDALELTARLAQSAERKALNLVVVGSSPTVGGCSYRGK